MAIDRAVSYHHRWMLKMAAAVVKESLERAAKHWVLQPEGLLVVGKRKFWGS